MSAYRELVTHLRSLADIRAILAGMRTLAIIETQRLTRLRDSGQRLRTGLQRAVQIYRAHHPPDTASIGAGITVVIGSEKGLCGDFNEELLRHVRALPADRALVLVGDKLAAGAEGLRQVVTRRPGALASDAIAPVLAGLADTLLGRNAEHGSPLTVITHDPEQRRIRTQTVLPLPSALPAAAGVSPRLNLPSPAFEAALVEQYLFAMLTGALQDALLAENQQRVAHLQAAVRRLDERCARFQQQLRRTRQEQIIEEVEVALSIGDSGLDVVQQLT